MGWRTRRVRRVLRVLFLVSRARRIVLDDIFVRPAFRKHGIGTALLAHVAGIAWKEKYFCMRWEVLDWNKQAIEFYNNLGAVFLEEWKPVVLIGDALEAAAKGTV
jgi:GNAT superfamily N-acetyltransferase